VRPLFLTGLALWAPGHASLEAFMQGAHDPSVEDAPCAWVPPRLLRGSSRLTRMFGEAAAQAVTAAGRDPKTIATIYTSSYGEIETMVLLLDTIFRGDCQLSPMRFKNSVHNAGSGLGSIGQGNTAFSTALAAGARSFEAGMLEALALVNERGGDAVVSCADDVIPAPLSRAERGEHPREALSVGVVISAEPTERSLARITRVLALPVRAPMPGEALGRAIAPGLRNNPAAHALPLFDALVGARPLAPGHVVPLAFDADAPYGLELTRD
jgi:hypothetical protein